ncbi:hypothetical protein FO519_002289 [Halicephalobus sp. NKZ332]|nr:hypothetical protein FO519_002289 [Halicephalobus sp. NKZ332]
MSDLSAFFAKKSQKSKDRKKKVNVGDIAKQLERTARIHERAEREEAERQLRDDHHVNNAPKNEDSEWLEDADDDLTSKLEEIGIKGMDVSELTDEEEEEEEKGEVEPAKTWNFDQNGTAVKESERAEDVAPVKTKYVPPVNRFGGARRGNQAPLDLKNEEMFPSIANADKIEKEMSRLEDKNVKSAAQGGWKTQGENNDAKQTQTAPGVYRPPHRQTNYTNPPTQGRVTSNNPASSTGNKYVIPTKRSG